MITVPGYTLTDRIYASKKSLVYLGTRDRDNLPILIKTPQSAYPSERALRHFHASHEIADKFDHPGIANSIDSGICNNRHYVVFEYKGTLDLRQYQSQQKHQVFTIEQFLNIAIQLADILGTIHHKNVIFKDLHPGNILVHPKTGDVQLADFGLASVLSRESRSLEPPEYVEGVLGFVSPEQTGRMNRSLDYRSDLYSLGVCFYVMLSGETPFQEADDLATIHASIAKHHAPIKTKRNDIPEVISRLIDKLLQKNAEDRYQSAMGVKTDLQKCLKQWLDQRHIQHFELAEQDISNQLEIPQKLYGREKEIHQILGCFEQVRANNPRLLLVSGPAGIGKTSLVKEIQQHIALREGFFVYGKVHTQNKSRPFYPFKQALKAWASYNLSRDEESLKPLKEEISTKLEDHLSYLADFLPELNFLLPSIPKLTSRNKDSAEYKKELKFTLHQLIKIIANDKPIILLIDNLQWADNDSHNLFKSLTSILKAKLLLIGCYRSGNIKPSHRLTRVIDHATHAMVHTKIELEPLNSSAIKSLLSDALKTKPTTVEELSHITLQKTLGYPNLIHSFLESLYFQKLINFNLKSKSWRWDISKIRNADIDNRTAKLICEKIRHLPKPTHQLIGLAACIGKDFELELLAKLLAPEVDVSAVKDMIIPALSSGILVESEHSPVHYHFAHTKVRRDAYKIIPENKREQVHYAIAYAITDLENSHQYYPINYCIADHLNMARKHINSNQELTKLAALNLKAAFSASQEDNWIATYNYCNEGICSLAHDCWSDQYSLAKSLFDLKLKALFRQGYYEQAVEVVNCHISLLRTNQEKGEWCFELLYESQASLNYQSGKRFAAEGLKYLGSPISLNVESNKSAKDTIEKLHAFLISKTPFRDAQCIKCPKERLIQRLYGQLGLTLFLSRDEAFDSLVIHATEHIFQSGICADSALIISLMAIVGIKEQAFKLAFELSDISLSILDNSANNLYLDSIYGLIGAQISPYKDSLARVLAIQNKGYEQAIQRQNHISTHSNYLNCIVTSFLNAVPLNEIEHMLKELETSQSMHRQHSFETQLLRRFIHALSTKSKNSMLERTSFSKDQWRAICQNSSGNLLNSLRYQYYFWNDQLDLILEDSSERFTNGIQNIVVKTDYEMMTNIAYCRSSDAKYKELIKSFITKLDGLRKLNPENFEHKYLLVKAEFSQYINEPQLNTVRLYEQALKSAGAHNFIQYQAYANERLGDLWFGENNNEYAFINYRKALYLYRRWNCQLKAHKLAKKADLLKRQSKRRNTKTRFLDNVVPISSSRRNLTDNIDLMTVLRSSQAISRNMPLESLLNQILTLILQNSGAQVASILLKHGKDLAIANYLDTDDLEGDISESDLPEEIINYVQRTKNVLLIQDTALPSSLAQNKAVQKRNVRSLLCSPILYRDTFMGVLYLENRITTNAFTLQRLNIINALLNQASISLENTRYHQDIEQLNRNLEQLVDVRTHDLQMINSELEELSYSMSHDLKAPLRSIKGFTQALVEDFGSHLNTDALDYLNRIQKGSDKTTDMMQGLNRLYRTPLPRVSHRMVNTHQLANQIISRVSSRYKDHQPQIKNNLPLTYEGDESILAEVFDALIDNAFKFTQNSDEPSMEIGVTEIESRTTFFVKDNGIGFSPQLKHRLFHNFQRLHSETIFSGSGLGLATARKAIERYNGEIWAESEEGKGTTFLFTLDSVNSNESLTP